MDLSIIIPIYNVERYLKKCLDSIYCQILNLPVEVILVNDGTKDNSMKIVKRFQERYPKKIVCLEKENGGLSDARNFAIPYAKGEYIAFLDSDDTHPAHIFQLIQQRTYLSLISLISRTLFLSTFSI